MDSPMAEEKGRKFRIRVRPTRWNYIGALLSLVGFILILVCLVGGFTNEGRGIYFAKIQGGNTTATFGLLGYCTDQGTPQVTCVRDDDARSIPFTVTVPNLLNDTFPLLFAEPATLDSSVYPETASQPSHDPRILAASIICLICSGAAIAIGFCKIFFYTRVQDASYMRGFCALGSAVVALLLVSETYVMYQNGVGFLNLMYPNLVATTGPGMTMVGISFLLFFLSSVAYLQGCFSSNGGDEGYEML